MVHTNLKRIKNMSGAFAKMCKCVCGTFAIEKRALYNKNSSTYIGMKDITEVTYGNGESG